MKGENSLTVCDFNIDLTYAIYLLIQDNKREREDNV